MSNSAVFMVFLLGMIIGYVMYVIFEKDKLRRSLASYIYTGALGIWEILGYCFLDCGLVILVCGIILVIENMFLGFIAISDNYYGKEDI